MSAPLIQDVLRKPVTRFRAAPARGLKPRKAEQSAVDRTGGDSGAGLIRGAAIVTRGEAFGHDEWLDREFLDQVQAAAAATSQGVKVRFTHPGLSADGLGTFLGRAKNPYVDGEAVRADLHLSETAHATPDGDLAGYVMDLAEKDPEAFGLSIVYVVDVGAERRFAAEHENEDGTFESPDPDNANNYRHARLAELRAADVVDEPAANPTGLFHRGDELASDAEALLSYATGLCQDPPALAALDVDADRITGFVARFLDRHGLEITSKATSQEPNMADQEKPSEPQTEPVDQAAAQPETKPAEQTETPPAETALAQQAAGDTVDQRAEFRRFVESFGACRAAGYYAAGKTYEEAAAAYAVDLKAENEDLRKKLSAVNRGETEALSGSHAAELKSGAKAGKHEALGPNLARVADGITFKN